MATDTRSLEEILPELTEAIGLANWRLQDLAIRWQSQPFPAATVNAIDVAYCEVEAACDVMRMALCRRQRELREAAAANEG